MNREDIEALHEQASGYYLEGNIEGALDTWRRLLAANPDDERAREGVELCERLSGCESESVVTEGHSPFAVGGMDAAQMPPERQGAPSAAAEAKPGPEPIEDPLDRLLDLGPSTPRTPAAPPAQAANPDGGDGELDLSDLRDESEGTSSEGFSFEDLFPDAPPVRSAPAETPAPTETVWTFGEGPPEPEPAPEPSAEPMWPITRPEGPGASDRPAPKPPPADVAPPEATSDTETVPAPEAGDADDDSAAATLHRRASDLLGTALEEMQRGERTAALHTLERLLILDDQNEAARSLTQKLRAEIGAEGGVDATQGAPAATSPEPGAADGIELEVGDPLTLEPSGLETGASDGADSAAGQEPADADVNGSARAVPAFGTDGGDGNGLTAEAPVAGAPGRRFWLPPRKVWIPAAAVLVLGAGYLVWSLFIAGGAEPVPLDAPVREVKAGKARPSDKSTTEKPPVEADGGNEEAPPEKTVEEQIAEAIARAEQSLASADYAEAVIALDEALALDPENAQIRKRLEAAGESYRVQQEKRERWDRAISDFDRGDFQSALSYFYRLPPEEQTEQVRRYILNGWYNLGVLALKNRNCDEAGSHFREARALAPDDPEVNEAIGLARRCEFEGVAELRATVSDLEYRGVGASGLGSGTISGGSDGGP